MWELEKIGNSDLLSQALRKQEEKSENSYHPSHSFQFLKWLAQIRKTRLLF